MNAANESLKHGGGVAFAIAKKGGPVIQQDSDDYVRSRGIVPTGNAVLRKKVGALPPPYKAIVHAVGPSWNRLLPTHDKEIALLRKTCRRALVCAKSYGSIAIPAISSGLYGFPIDVCADALVKAAVEFSEMEEENELCDINFVILEQSTSAFQKAAETHIGNVSSYRQSGTSQVLASGGSPLDTSTKDTSRPSQMTRTKRRSATAPAPTRSYQQPSLQKIKITQGSILDVQVG